MADPGGWGGGRGTGSPLSKDLDDRAPLISRSGSGKAINSSLTREEAVVSWTPISWFYIAGVVMVGPIGVKKPGALPPDLQEFLQDTGGHGFIIVSFGSYVEKIIPKEKIDMMAAAFAKLKQKVLWRQKGNVSYIYRGLLCATLYQTNYC